MKKALCVAMALAMTVGMSAAVFADETESAQEGVVKFSYQDIDPDVYEGAWFSTGLGFDMYLPADWEVAELTDDMVEAGVAFVAGNEEDGANTVITYTQVPEEAGDYDMDALGEEIAAANTTAVYADLNGIPAVIFENEESEVDGFAMLAEGGYVISGVISAPADVEFADYDPFFQNIIMSISPTEAETEG